MQDSLATHIDNALRNGDHARAEALCRQALARTPQAAPLHLLLGRLLRRRGQYEAAAASLREALHREPRQPDAWRELALAALQGNQLEQAAAAAQQLRQLAPADAQAAFLHGHVLGLLHHFDAATQAFAPLRDTPLAQGRLGLVADALARGDAVAARFHAEQLVTWLPQQAAAWDALGQAAAAAQDWAASTAALREATRLAPEDIALWQRRAAALDNWRQGGLELVEVREQLLRLQPQSETALEQLGLAQIGAHRTQAAVDTFQQLRERTPDNLLARWVLFHTPGLPCFASTDQRAQWLHDWQQGLAAFEALPDDHAGLADAARRILGSVPDFALAYQEGAHVDLHRRHAAVVRRLLDAATGQAYADIPPRRIAAGRRRIGLLSSCLHRHSVTRAWGEALLALPREDFELCVFHTGSGDDAMARRFRARADHWHSGADRFATWVDRLRAADLDVLIFLDLGLDVTNQALAALRHAPVQAVTWAHPVTSGAAAIDYFLGADAAEPVQAASHYSEILHRLPRLGGCFARPDAPLLPRLPSGRGAHLMCLQNLYKLHPQHDALFGDILARVPAATLEFLTGASPEQAQGFERRLRHSLAGYAIDPARVQVRPALADADYQAALGRADLLLDTLGFSGGITTLDALWQQRPWLTLPGECMRGRQSFAMLRALGLDALIAESRDDYVRRAVALASDSERREQLGREIAQRKHLLFEDHGVSAALADFLREVQPPEGRSHA